MTQYRRDPYYVNSVRSRGVLRRWRPLLQSAVMITALYAALALGFAL